MGASSGGCGVPGILLPAGCVTQPQMDALWKHSRANERTDGRTEWEECSRGDKESR